MPGFSQFALNRSGLDWLHLRELMRPNSLWPSHVSGIHGKANIFTQDVLKIKPVDHNPDSSALFSPNPNTPPSSCLTTIDSSSIPHVLDNQNQSIPSYILANHYHKTPPLSSRMVNHSCTSFSELSCNEFVSGLNNQKLDNCIATYFPSISHNNPCSILTNHHPNTPSSSSNLIKQCSASSTARNQDQNNSKAIYLPCVNYGSTSDYQIYDGDWNQGEIHMQQSMDPDQKHPLLSEVNLDEYLAPPVLSLPNMMINPDNVLCHSSERLNYQPGWQQSKLEQQQKMGIFEPNFQYFGSVISCSGFTENASDMEMGMCEDSIDTPAQIDQINNLQDQGISGKNLERKQKRKLKNRESAARSRAKKQAFVNYLENKSWTLKRDNDRLNKEQAFLRSSPRPKLQLRRTSSVEAIEKVAYR